MYKPGTKASIPRRNLKTYSLSPVEETYRPATIYYNHPKKKQKIMPAIHEGHEMYSGWRMYQYDVPGG